MRGSDRTNCVRVEKSRVTYRALTTTIDLQQVVELSAKIWSRSDEDHRVSASLLRAAVRRGGIVIGAFDGPADMVGFVYSIPCFREGRTIQFSCLLGVAPIWRGAGVDYELKRLQRCRALDMDLDLIEWAFDPLEASEADFSLRGLGAVAHTYAENFV